jgi:hypothetical protein
LAAASVLAACDVSAHFSMGDGVDGNGIERTEERVVEPFEEVRFAGEGRLEITVGGHQSLSITADDNLLPLIETVVEDETLQIRMIEEIDPDVDLVVRVTTPDLRAVACSGAGSVDVRGLAADDFAVGVSGAAKVDLEGRADTVELNLSGVGSIQAGDLVAREAVVRVSGVGHAHVNASDLVDARVSGVGSVTYEGDPELRESISGLAKISRHD